MKSLKFLTWTGDNGQRKQLNVVQALAKNWKDLGDYLEIKNDVLCHFEKKYKRNPLECCREVMLTWTEQRETVSSSPTWEVLYNILMHLGHVDVANDLMEAIPDLDVQHH